MRAPILISEDCTDPALLKAALESLYCPDPYSSFEACTESLPVIADHMRHLLEGRLFSISTLEYANTKSPNLRCENDCFLRTDWADGSNQLIRVFENYISFSAGDWLWCVNPGDFVSFTPDSMLLRAKSPAGYEFHRLFKVQKNIAWTQKTYLKIHKLLQRQNAPVSARFDSEKR